MKIFEIFSWGSPPADKIVYVGIAASSTQDIYVMNSNGSGQKSIDTGNDTKVDNKPDWQPIPQCTINGTPGDDTGKNAIIGTAGNDVICGLGGNDTIKGLGGNDIVRGDAGKDTVVGGVNTTPDALRGNAGNDVIKARPDSSATSGGGVDSNGNDMSGGAGNDKIFGSDGSDTIEMLSESPRSGNDRIYRVTAATTASTREMGNRTESIAVPETMTGSGSTPVKMWCSAAARPYSRSLLLHRKRDLLQARPCLASAGNHSNE